MLGDIASLGLTLGTMGSMVNMTKEALDPIAKDTMSAGHSIGNAVQGAVNGWSCSCGTNNITSKFCPECGSKKPEAPAGWDCPSCGNKGITSKFCPECGAKKPEAPEKWTCPECGKTDITSKFCPECGTKKEG